MEEIKVKSELKPDEYLLARECGVGVFIAGGWLEKHKVLEFADKLRTALLEDK